MKALSTLVFCFLAASAFALNHTTVTQAYNHLNEVNAQWQLHAASAPLETRWFQTDVQRIRYHLTHVEKYLRAHAPANLSAEAKQNREALLDVLREYAAAEKFPTNTYHATRTPYFIDNFNVYCAVGYLISKSGHDKLARRINAEHRFDFIRDIQTRGLTEWAAAHGFTEHELAWIQPAYAPSTSVSAIQGGTDGPVDVVLNDYTNNRLVFAGDFNYVNNVACANIGQYKNGQLECIGSGLDGVLNDALVSSSGLYAAGNFNNGNATFPLAKFDGSAWQMIEIPGRENATAHAVYYGVSSNKLTVVLSHAAMPGKQEIWFLNQNEFWDKRATVTGVINDIEATPYGCVFAGQFPSVTVHGSLDEIVPVNNVVFFESYGNEWQGIGTAVSSNVLAVESIGMAVYFAGECGNGAGNVCLTRYFNNTLQPLVTSTDFGDAPAAIHDLELHQGNTLMLAGDFDLYPMGIGNWAKNLAAFDLVNNHVFAIASLNDKVTSLAPYNGEMHFGGYFTANEVGGGSLPHLAKIDEATFIENVKNSGDLVLFPNPATENVTIAAKDRFGIETLRVFDVLGRAVAEIAQPEMPFVLDVTGFEPGVFVVSVESKDKRRATQTFVVR